MVAILAELLRGLPITIAIAAAASALAVAIAILAACASLSKSRLLRGISRCYVELFRGTSLLVQLFWLFFVLPQFGVELSPFAVAVVGIGLNIGAYGAEVVRGAIVATPRDQVEATIALNMSKGLALRRIVLPQAAVRMILPWGNLLVILLKSTAVVSLITIQDITFRAYNLNGLTFETIQIYTVTLLIYFVLAQIISLSVQAFYKRATIHMVMGR